MTEIDVWTREMSWIALLGELD